MLFLFFSLVTCARITYIPPITGDRVFACGCFLDWDGKVERNPTMEVEMVLHGLVDGVFLFLGGGGWGG